MGIRDYIKIALRNINHTKALRNLLDTLTSLTFDAETKNFFIKDKNISPEERVYYKNMLIAKTISINPTTTITIDSINTGYLDRCLEHYIWQRLNGGVTNEKTCFLNNVINNGCMGWIDPEIEFNLEVKKQYLKKRSHHKSKFKNEEYYLDRMVRRSDGSIFILSDSVFKEDYKILTLCDNIRKNGFNSTKFICPPVVIGFSTSTGHHNVIVGRHRVAVLKYLAKQGELNSSMGIKCHLIKYPYNSLSYIRPYEYICQTCEQEGITISNTMEKTYLKN